LFAKTSLPFLIDLNSPPSLYAYCKAAYDIGYTVYDTCKIAMMLVALSAGKNQR